MFKILIVDDEKHIRELVRDVLSIINCEIITAENGREAWEKIQNLNFDLVITDLEMPEMNGIELCEKIKKDNRFSHIPVIMLTVRSREKDEIMGIVAGADDYITKPFKPKILTVRVLAALRKYSDQENG